MALGVKEFSGCGASEVEEKAAIDSVKSAWRDFVRATASVDPDKPVYKVRREQMTRSIVGSFRFLSQECVKAITRETSPGDNLGRSKLDIALDDLVLELLEDYPLHPHLGDWFVDKPYWLDFVDSKKGNGWWGSFLKRRSLK